MRIVTGDPDALKIDILSAIASADTYAAANPDDQPAQYVSFANVTGLAMAAARVPAATQTTAYVAALTQAIKSNATDAGIVLSIAIAAGQAGQLESILSQACKSARPCHCATLM